MHELPCDPTSLVKWRQRVGVAGSEKLLKESLAAAQREAVLTEAELKRVNVDTPVQEKAIAFPTDVVTSSYAKVTCGWASARW